MRLRLTSTIAWIRAPRAACKIVVVLDAARADGNGTDMAHGHTRKLSDREVLEDLVSAAILPRETEPLRMGRYVQSVQQAVEAQVFQSHVTVFCWWAELSTLGLGEPLCVLSMGQAVLFHSV